MTHDSNLSPHRYLLAPWEEDAPEPQLRARRDGTIAIVLSVLVHIVALLWSIHHQMTNEGTANQPEPMAVRLQSAAQSSPPPPAPPKPIDKKKPPPRSSVIALSKPTPQSRRMAVQPPVPVPPLPENNPVPDPNAAPTDMMSMVNAARARRNAAEANAVRENADAAGNARGPSDDDIAMANINRNLARGQGGATGGIFEILSKGTRTAQFAFNGWTNTGVRNKWRDVIDVDAGLGGDIELAIVRRMIELIRTHYTGDFNWDSHRLGRVVIMSARPQDSAELEAFMLHEFFDDRQGPPRVH